MMLHKSYLNSRGSGSGNARNHLATASDSGIVDDDCSVASGKSVYSEADAGSHKHRVDVDGNNVRYIKNKSKLSKRVHFDSGSSSKFMPISITLPHSPYIEKDSLNTQHPVSELTPVPSILNAVQNGENRSQSILEGISRPSFTTTSSSWKEESTSVQGLKHFKELHHDLIGEKALSKSLSEAKRLREYRNDSIEKKE